MPALANTKHEKFAQELCAGTHYERAYEVAGYKASQKNAAALKADYRIRERVAELYKSAQEARGATVDTVVAELAKIAFATPQELMAWDAKVSDKVTCLVQLGKNLGMFLKAPEPPKVENHLHLHDSPAAKIRSLLAGLASREGTGSDPLPVLAEGDGSPSMGLGLLESPRTEATERPKILELVANPQ